jgi:hypothetical protein
VQPDQLASVGGPVGRLPGHALEEQNTQGVQVGPAVDRALEHAGLLRGAVQQRAGDPVVLRAAARDQAEVDQAGGAVLAHDDVVRLDVAVDQTGPVGGAERADDVDRELERPLLVEPADAQGLRQRAAVDALQNQVRAGGDLADLEDPGEQGVADAAQQRRLPAHRRQCPRGVAIDPGQQLESVVGTLAADTVDDGLGAAPQLRDHFEVGESARRHPGDHRQTCPSALP